MLDDDVFVVERVNLFSVVHISFFHFHVVPSVSFFSFPCAAVEISSLTTFDVISRLVEPERTETEKLCCRHYLLFSPITQIVNVIFEILILNYLLCLNQLTKKKLFLN